MAPDPHEAVAGHSFHTRRSLGVYDLAILGWCLTYLLHCLPGDIRSKAIVFEHLRPVANPGAVVFGARLLQGGVDRNRYARAVMKWNNDRDVFSNALDDVGGLQWALAQHLDDVTIDVVGCVGLSTGRT